MLLTKTPTSNLEFEASYSDLTASDSDLTASDSDLICQMCVILSGIKA